MIFFRIPVYLFGFVKQFCSPKSQHGWPLARNLQLWPPTQKGCAWCGVSSLLVLSLNLLLIQLLKHVTVVHTNEVENMVCTIVDNFNNTSGLTGYLGYCAMIGA